MPNTPRGFRPVAAILVAAVTGSLLVGCESPFQAQPVEHFGGRYANAILIRTIMDANLQNESVRPTINSGVQEYGRVDNTGTGAIDPGAETGPDTEPSTASAPTSHFPPGIPKKFERYSQVSGLIDAQLRTPEGNLQVSLQECLARAMKHNLDIAVESFNPAIKDYQIISAWAVFDPSIFGNNQLNNIDQPDPNAASTRGINFQNQVGIKELLPSGGQVSLSVGDNYSDLNPPHGSGIPPTHGHAPFINLTVNHPLLRGFGADVNYANIYLAQRDRSISLSAFRQKVIEVCANTEEAYHNLVLATETVVITERLLADTDITRERVYRRLLIDADAVSYFQAASAVEQRNAELIRARSDLRTASDKLKALLNDPELDLRSNVLLVPRDRPTTDPMTYNVAEVIDTALHQRTELQQARLQIEKTDIIVDATKNDLLPKVNLVLSVQSNGNIDNGLDQAFTSTINSAHFIDYIAGIQWEFSLGNRDATARLNQHQTERRQALVVMIRTAQLVVEDVKLQLRQVFTSYAEIGARERARAYTSRELHGLNQKESIQALTPEFLRLKLDTQQRLALSEIAEITSIVNYNIAVARLEQSKGTLLEYNRIAINTEPPPLPMSSMWLIGQSIEWKNPFQK